MVTGVNLPATQLHLAMALPLHRIRHIRQLYGVAPNVNSGIDFDMVKNLVPRVTSSPPVSPPRIPMVSSNLLIFRSNTNVWGYFSVCTAGGLHEFADPQFGYVFPCGEDRNEKPT